MINIPNIKETIVKVTFYLNICLLVIGIFLTSKIYFITVIVINIILNGTHMIFSKYGNVLTGAYSGLKVVKDLNNSLEFFSGSSKK